MSATLVSSRQEGKNRKQKKVAFEGKEKDAVTGGLKEKIGPPSATKAPTEDEGDRDLEVEKSRLLKAKKEFLKGKSLPYVDVPPRRTTLRSPVSTPVREDQMTSVGPAYKSQAPVEIGVDIDKIIEQVLDLEINVPLRSLAGVSGQIQKEIRRQVTKSRVPIEREGATQVNLVSEVPQRKKIRLENLPVAMYTISTEVMDDVPEGSLVAGDPVLQYLAEHKEVESEDLVVAVKSEALRTIFMTVNRIGQEECLLDNGSMIVSMSRESAVHLGLTWDPALRINMESASNHIEKTLGLARNVRFAVGGIEVFLQVHILERPPYRILLGRPFDTFTSSIHKTNSDGSSELVLTDPNSKIVAVVPTYKRGQGPEVIHKQAYQDF